MDYHILQSAPLFAGIREEELPVLLACLEAREGGYSRGQVILRAGAPTDRIGLVERGSVNIVVSFYWGGSHIFGHMEAGQIFAESYAAVPGRELPCDVVAAEDCEILFLRMEKLLNPCGQGCPCHARLIHNLIGISAMKNLNLSARMMHTAPKSIRERLLSYFSEQALRAGGSQFTIPFSRQQLADYLAVDRSALSAALSRMQRDGLITYHKNTFTLHESKRGERS